MNQFSRTELLIGKEGLAKLAQSYVAIFGIGGVGAYAAEGLARAGVGRFMLVDSDYICLTNLNRQIHATTLTIGLPKVQVMAERILAINPLAEVHVSQTFYLPDQNSSLVTSEYDYLIDAVDTVTAKIGLAVQGTELSVPVISSMGAGNKLDPSRLTIGDIYATSVCPLAKIMRKELRKRGIKSLKVVYTTEPPIQPADAPDADPPVCSYAEICPTPCTSATPNHRRHTPGSISFVPSVAGLLIAGEVVRDLLTLLTE